MSIFVHIVRMSEKKNTFELLVRKIQPLMHVIEINTTFGTTYFVSEFIFVSIAFGDGMNSMGCENNMK